MAACCHHLLHNTTTIEEGNDIVVVTLFATKPPKKVTAVVVAFFCSKAIEKGDRSYHCFLLLLKHREEGDNNIGILHMCFSILGKNGCNAIGFTSALKKHQ